MTSQPSTLSLSEGLAEQARYVTRQSAYVLLSHTSNIAIDAVQWIPYWPEYLAGAGPVQPEEIVGCRAKARLTIRWPRANSAPKRLLHAAAAVERLEFSDVWLRAILAHEPPPPCSVPTEDGTNLTWEVSLDIAREPEYDAVNEKLTFPVRLTGEK